MPPTRDPEHQAKVDHELVRVSALYAEMHRARRAVHQAVARARSVGTTWTEIAPRVGMTQQGAQKRFGGVGERAEAQWAIDQQTKQRRDARRAAAAAAAEDANAPG